MKAFMESQKDPPVFMESNYAGVQRVLDSDGQYAFLMESNSIQYQTERNCDLIQVGKLLDSKGYGIAFTPGKMNLCVTLSHQPNQRIVKIMLILKKIKTSCQ